MLGKFRSHFFFCILFSVGAAIAESSCDDGTLPLFTVQRHKASKSETLELAENLFGPDDYNVTCYDERYIVFSHDGTKRVEYDTVSGGIWAVDESALWNSEGPVPKLPSDAEAIELADALVTKYGLLPTEEGPVRVSGGQTSGTFLAHEYESEDGSGYKREEYQIDVSVNYIITLSISEWDKNVPLVGGGGKFQVTYGDCGKLIAFQGLWREILKETCLEPTPQAVADEQYLVSLGSINSSLIDFNSTLAYQSEPFGNHQKKMFPVLVYSGTAQVQNETVGLRPATSRDGDTTEEPQAKNTKRSINQGEPLHVRAVQDDDARLEAAVEWLGQGYGLSQAKRNVDGFKVGILGATPQWSISYDRENEDVWVSDFTTDDDTFSDSVDMLFYNGHANKNGWLANQQGTGVREWVQYSSFGTDPESPGDLLGQQDLEWLIIAACGPHQDQMFDPSAGNVFDRWRGIFDGLHIMFAYGSRSYDTDEEGSRLTKYSEEGYPLIDSWFRTAKESQPSDVIVTAIWTDGPGGNARGDHLPGYGWVSKDNLGSSQGRWFMWTTC